RRHQLEYRVLGPRHAHLTREGCRGAHDDHVVAGGRAIGDTVQRGDRRHGHQYAPAVPGRGLIVTRRWPDGPDVAGVLLTPRRDLLAERPTTAPLDGDTVAEFEQDHGPFCRYRRRVERHAGGWRETTE